MTQDSYLPRPLEAHKTAIDLDIEDRLSLRSDVERRRKKGDEKGLKRSFIAFGTTVCVW